MKAKLSITLDKRLLDSIDKTMKEGLFRNKSHLIEYSVKKFLEKRK